jgi:putative ABC transport system permease protein
VQSTIAFAALVLGAIAVGNVIASNIQGRRFEYGVLRAIGLTRGGLIRLVLAQAVLMAATGVLLGTIWGLHLAAIDASHLRDLAGLNVRVTFVPLTALAGWTMLVVITLLAASPPTIRLARAAPSALVAVGQNE